MNRLTQLAFLLLGTLAIAAPSGCARPAAADPAPDAKTALEIREKLQSKSSVSAGGESETQVTAKSTGWGTIKGRFVFDGPHVDPKTLTISKDVDVCGKHPLVNESLLVDSGGGLANVVLFLRNKNVDVHPDYTAGASEKVVLDNHDCHFVPHVLAVRTGQPLDIKNSDAVGHNTNVALTVNQPFNSIISSNTSAELKLASPEPSPTVVTCNIHPWMKGYLVVQANPYVAVSAKDGTFEIKNVPTGVPLEFQAWHEASTGNNGALAGNRPDLKWQNNGRFTVTLQPNETMDLKEIKVPASSLATQ